MYDKADVKFYPFTADDSIPPNVQANYLSTHEGKGKVLDCDRQFWVEQMEEISYKGPRLTPDELLYNQVWLKQ